MAESVDKLFVYGTLQPGGINHDKLAHLSGTWITATVSGTLIEEGWGADHGCPGLILDGAGEVVSGYLLTSEELPGEWQALDAFEGEEYARVLTEVSVPSGELVEAYVYVIGSRGVGG